MSAQLKTANLDKSVLSYKIVSDTRLDQNAIIDVTQGSGTLRSIEVDASAASADQYLKIKITTTEVVVGTTVPDIMLKCILQKRFITEFPGGLQFTGLSAWLVSSAGDSSDACPEAAAGRYTIVRFVTT